MIRHANSYTDESDTINNSLPVILNWKGNTIKSLKDLREFYSSEELLKAHMEKHLYTWLLQHYYESEASEVKTISLEDKDCLKKLCVALGIPFKDTISPEKLKELEMKQEKLSKHTNDQKLLNLANVAAFNQEDLAALIDANEKIILICSNSYSIPLSKPGIEYIAVGDVSIENAFTNELYNKLGIKIEGVTLPTELSEEKELYANSIARSNGYDDFNETHSEFTIRIHNQLKSRKLFDIYRLPSCSSISSKFFKSKYECEKARESIIRKAYETASAYFDINKSKSLAKTAADYYSNCIENVFNSIIELLKTYCVISEKTSNFNAIYDLTSHAKKNLRSRFESELQESSDYYSMYNYEYFLDQIDIEEHDYQISEDGLLRLLERIATDNIQYTLSGVFESVNELEKDLNERAGTFFSAAYREYCSYIRDIEDHIESLSQELPNFNENEDIHQYLKRMSIAQRI